MPKKTRHIENCPVGKIKSPKKRCIDQLGKTAKNYGLYTKPLTVTKLHKNWRVITQVYDFRYPIYHFLGSVRALSPDDQLLLEKILLKFTTKIVKEAVDRGVTVETALEEKFGYNKRTGKKQWDAFKKHPMAQNAWEIMREANPINPLLQQNVKNLEWKDVKSSEDFISVWFQLNRSKPISYLWGPDDSQWNDQSIWRVYYDMDEIMSAKREFDFYTIHYKERPLIANALDIQKKFHHLDIDDANHIILIETNIVVQLLTSFGKSDHDIIIGSKTITSEEQRKENSLIDALQQEPFLKQILLY